MSSQTQVELICPMCAQKYWANSGAEHLNGLPCPTCLDPATSPILRATGLSLTPGTATPPAGLADLHDALTKVGMPVGQSFWSNIACELQEKQVQSERAIQIATQRVTLLKSLADLARGVIAVQDAELTGRLELARKRLELLRVETEMRQLLQPKLSDSDTQEPTPSAEGDSRPRPTKKRRLHDRQAEAGEFLSEVHQIAASDTEDAAKVINIRDALAEYGREVADLPIEIQQFLDRVEGMVHG